MAKEPSDIAQTYFSGDLVGGWGVVRSLPSSKDNNYNYLCLTIYIKW